MGLFDRIRARRRSAGPRPAVPVSVGDRPRPGGAMSEPQTASHSMTIVLVAADGQWTRLPAGGPPGRGASGRRLGVRSMRRAEGGIPRNGCATDASSGSCAGAPADRTRRAIIVGCRAATSGPRRYPPGGVRRRGQPGRPDGRPWCAAGPIPHVVWDGVVACWPIPPHHPVRQPGGGAISGSPVRSRLRRDDTGRRLRGPSSRRCRRIRRARRPTGGRHGGVRLTSGAADRVASYTFRSPDPDLRPPGPVHPPGSLPSHIGPAGSPARWPRWLISAT